MSLSHRFPSTEPVQVINSLSPHRMLRFPLAAVTSPASWKYRPARMMSVISIPIPANIGNNEEQ
jgi:hypothetical protein